MSEPDDSDHSSSHLICPFLDDSLAYAYGVEFGTLWARMRDPDVDHIQDYVTAGNDEQLRVAAPRAGWEIVRMEPWEDGEHWVLVEMRRKGT